jgi:hypothetical protein
MSTNKPSWMTAEAIHLPESTSEMFVYQPVGDLDRAMKTCPQCDGEGTCAPMRRRSWTMTHGGYLQEVIRRPVSMCLGSGEVDDCDEEDEQ